MQEKDSQRQKQKKSAPLFKLTDPQKQFIQNKLPRGFLLLKVDENGNGVQHLQKEKKQQKKGNLGPQKQVEQKTKKVEQKQKKVQKSKRIIWERSINNINSRSVSRSVNNSSSMSRSRGPSEDTEISQESYEKCLKFIKIMKKKDTNDFFIKDVDIKKWNTPDYHNIIKYPMSINRITRKLIQGKYKSIQEFENDFLLMIQNSRKYNTEKKSEWALSITNEFQVHYTIQWRSIFQCQEQMTQDEKKKKKAILRNMKPCRRRLNFDEVQEKLQEKEKVEGQPNQQVEAQKKPVKKQKKRQKTKGKQKKMLQGQKEAHENILKLEGAGQYDVDEQDLRQRERENPRNKKVSEKLNVFMRLINESERESSSAQDSDESSSDSDYSAQLIPKIRRYQNIEKQRNEDRPLLGRRKQKNNTMKMSKVKVGRKKIATVREKLQYESYKEKQKKH